MVLDQNFTVIDSFIDKNELSEVNAEKDLVFYTRMAVQRIINNNSVLPIDDEFDSPVNGRLLLRISGLDFDRPLDYTYYVVVGQLKILSEDWVSVIGELVKNDLG